jgi:hypothetical protein
MKWAVRLRGPAALLVLCSSGAFGLFGSGCASPPMPRDPAYHIIRANRDGLAIDPLSEKPYERPEQFARHVNEVLSRAEQFAQQKCQTNAVTVRLLVHVHGGLNGFEDTRKRMELVPLIMNETNDWYYPVFIVWPSGFFETYGEHLLRIRQGHKINVVYGAITLPVVFTLDLLEALVVAPRHWIYQLDNMKQRAVSMGVLPDALLSTSWRVEDEMAAALTNAPIYKSRYLYELHEKLGRAGSDAFQSPIRATLGTLVQSTISQESWRNMNRRTSTLFYPAAMFDMQKRGQLDERIEAIQHRSGSDFFRVLLERVKSQRTNGFDYEVTFIGHSMGTIVLNKLFTEYREALIESGAVRNIVYMGAACSINQTANAIKPLLLAANTNGHTRAAVDTGTPGSTPSALNSWRPPLRFYNLTLNRVAEISETSAWGFIPCGSLLDNIDDHLESPDTPLDRTMGSEVNILSSVEVFKDVFEYCQFKSFDRIPGCLPAEHADFHLCPFWRSAFWQYDHFVPAPTNTWRGKRNCYPRDWRKGDETGLVPEISH